MQAVLIVASCTTLAAGFGAIVLYAPRAYELWRDRLDTSDEMQRFSASCLVVFCGVCAMATAINSLVR